MLPRFIDGKQTRGDADAAIEVIKPVHWDRVGMPRPYVHPYGEGGA